MYSLLYFDTEDFASPPDSPVHRLPGQLAEIMEKHGLVGCFHIHGEKARFMERRGQTDAIEAIRRHDVSLHFDRGSLHPTTAEEVSELDWFRGVDRVLFRELVGFQTLERIFGKCSGLTQHGGTFAAQIVYAAGKMRKPFFYSPFKALGGRNVCWFTNSLMLAGYQAPFYFDTAYRDTPRFEEALAKVDEYLAERAQNVDFVPMFGCHPVITITERFPDTINAADGHTLPPSQWAPPTLIEGVSVPLVLENFERLVRKLVAHPDVEWTTVAGLDDRYGWRPKRVTDAAVLDGARQVIANRGPTFTPLLTAGELLVLLARRVVAPAASYDVPQVMGPPAEDARVVEQVVAGLDTRQVAHEILVGVCDSGYLPACLSATCARLGPAAALALLACEATGDEPRRVGAWRLTVEAIAGVPEATACVAGYGRWGIHGPRYHASAIRAHFRLQCWTYKPAFTRREYAATAPDAAIGRRLNPMIYGEW